MMAQGVKALGIQTGQPEFNPQTHMKIAEEVLSTKLSSDRHGGTVEMAWTHI